MFINLCQILIINFFQIEYIVIQQEANQLVLDNPSIFKHVKQEDLPDSKIYVNDEALPLTIDEVDKMVRWQINNGSKQTYDELFAWFKPIVKYLMKDGSYEVRFKGWFGGIYNVNKDFTEIKLIGRQ